MSGVTEQTRVLAGVPALVCSADDGARSPAVLFYHGFRARKEVHRKEGRSLAQAGLTAVLIDAPHHGAREDGVVDARDISGVALDRLLVRIVDEAVAELPVLIDTLLAAGHPAVAIAGISMGAYIALAAGVAEPRLAAIASLLGSPVWVSTEGPVPEDLAATSLRDPMHLHAKFLPRPLLLLNGGRDVNVRPEPARRLGSLLRPLYAQAGVPERLVHHEYPQAGHFMGERDWHDLWATTLAFLTRALGA